MEKRNNSSRSSSGVRKADKKDARAQVKAVEEETMDKDGQGEKNKENKDEPLITGDVAEQPSQPKVLGRWRVVRKIGSGAFGEVYEGVHTVHEARIGAIKVERTPEKPKKQVLRHEMVVLTKLKGSPFVPKFF